MTDERVSEPGAVTYKGDLSSNYPMARMLSAETADTWAGVLRAFLTTLDRPTVLDLGCGTGRFSTFWRLCQNLRQPPGLNRQGKPMKEIALSEVKDDLSRYLRLAEDEPIVITRHGKPAGILVGFKSEDDWFEYRLEHDPRFLRRIEAARQSLQSGRGVKLEDVER